MRQLIILVTVLILGDMFLSGQARAQVPAPLDTVKLILVGGDNWNCISEDQFTVQVLLSANEREYFAGTIPLTWASDSANWQLDTAIYGPVISGWFFQGPVDTALTNSMAGAITGGTALSGAPFSIESNQLWCELQFSLKPGATWGFGDVLVIDTVTIIEIGWELLLLDEFGVQYTPVFQGPLVIPFPPGCCCTPGDADGNNTVNIADVTYLISRIFANGSAPKCGGGN